MVNITNGKEVFNVPESTFKDIFKRQGFYKMEKVKAEETVENENEEMTKEEIFAKELLEKPIGEWSVKEVKEFAKIKGIDLSGTKDVNEAKERIKKHMEM